MTTLRPRSAESLHRFAELVHQFEVRRRLADGGHSARATRLQIPGPGCPDLDCTGHLFFRVTRRVALQSFETPAEVV